MLEVHIKLFMRKQRVLPPSRVPAPCERRGFQLTRTRRAGAARGGREASVDNREGVVREAVGERDNSDCEVTGV